MTSPVGSKKLRVMIIGARGYSGLELARLLLKHPRVELRAALATQADWSLADLLPESAAGAVPVMAMDRLPGLLADRSADLYFLATPIEVSKELAPRILEAGARVIDLSGAFRFENEGTLGLSPWQAITPETRMVANPGCYATSVMMAVVPLLKAGLLADGTLVVDAKSGTSGAGKKASEDLLYSEIDGECLPYRIARHQHAPEIELGFARFGGKKADLMFTTHLLPLRRGILSSIYGRVKAGTTVEQLASAYATAYAAYPLVRHGVAEKTPLLSLRRVVGSARTHLSYALDGEKLFLFSMIDNLLKGAASQAVENMNGMLGLPPSFNLEVEEGLL